jgi:hypothetical protein
MSIGLGDEQLEIDDLGRMDDWPRQAAAQGPGRIDRREAANVGQRAVGDVMPEGGNRVRTGAALVDRGGYPGIPSSLRRRERARPATFSTPSRRSPTRKPGFDPAPRPQPIGVSIRRRDHSLSGRRYVRHGRGRGILRGQRRDESASAGGRQPTRELRRRRQGRDGGRWRSRFGCREAGAAAGPVTRNDSALRVD